MHRTTAAIRASAALLLLPLAAAGPRAPARPEPASADRYAGRYAMELRLGSVTRVPLVGSDRSVTRTLMLVDVQRSGDGWTQRQTVCDVAIASSRVRMTVPDAFVDAFPTRSYASTFAAGEEGRYRADLGTEHIGYDPRETGGALPRDADAPGVLDSDGDGQPGATVVGHFPLFGSVRLFIAQRSHLVLRGRQTAADRIEGTVEVRLLEQRTLGADHRMFRRTPEVRPDPASSRFAMVRTEARTCEDLRGRARDLFSE